MARRSAGWWRFWWPLVLCWVLPVVAFAAVLPVAHRHQARAVAAADPVSVVVGQRNQDFTQSVNVVFSLSAVPSVRSAAGGVVTGVAVKAGGGLAQGEVVVSVDGTDRLAYVGRSPQYRELGVGDKGSDVAQLHAYLRDLGLAHGASGSTYTTATAGAVKALQRRIHAGADGRFRPDYVVYVPAGAGVVADVAVTTGDAIAPGDVVLHGTPRALGARLEPTGDKSVDALSFDEPLAVTIGAKKVTTRSGRLTAQEAEAIYALAAPAMAASASADTGPGTQLSGAMVALATAHQIGTAPVSAIYASAAGVQCVFAAKAGAQATAASVEPGSVEVVRLADPQLVTGELGIASVPKDLVGRAVVRDPATLPADVRDRCA